ncbi:MAG: PEP/pyruvate-binding domain-containing protein [Nitrospiraceae bacterium]
MVTCRSICVRSSTTPPEAISARDVGEKAWNLSRLQGWGFAVPRWVVIPRSVFDDVTHSEQKRIAHILSSLDFGSHKALEEASAQIRSIIMDSGLKDEFADELFLVIEDTVGKGSLLAVRSSVIGEDSVENSFAGQMDSFLNVQPADVVPAIEEVWASAFSARAITYRHRKKISLTEVSTAVIIQEMVHAETSGVLFTRDPETGERRCVISAGFGLGQGVVANLVETDTYTLAWDSHAITKEVRRKDYRIIRDNGDLRGVRPELLPWEQQEQQVLTDTQIHHLRSLALKAEEYFGAPQDIEWAFDADGKLFVLQARPIVFPNHNIPRARFRIWDNSNIVESFPGLTLPLTFSIVRKAYETTFCNTALGFVLSKEVIRQKPHIFRNLIGLLEGRVYYNLLNWYEMYSYLPGFKKHKDSFDQMIGISQQIDFPQANLSPIDTPYSLAMILWKLMRVKARARRFFAYFNAAYARYKDMDVSRLNEENLIAIYDALQRDLMRKWHLTLENDLCAMTYYDWLKRLCGRWRLAGLENDLLCGQKGIESVAPVCSLVRLAEMFRADPTYEALIRDQDDGAVWERIQHEPRYRPLKEAFEVHLHEFGDRSLEELKLEKTTFREEPQSLISLVRNYYNGGLSVAQMEEQERGVRQAAEKRVRQDLKNPIQRIVFRVVLRKARLAIANRENMRFARSRAYGLVRRIFRRMGHLLVGRGVLGAQDDIFYLTVDEVFGFVEGTAVTQNLQALTQLRKADYSQFGQRALADRLETTGIPYLSPLSGSVPGNGASNQLKGIGCSSGVAQGTAHVILDPRSPLDSRNGILITKSTDPGWVFLMIASRGIVVEKGSVLSHTAIIGRELGIPTVIGARGATAQIPDGASVLMNGGTGDIRWGS